MGAGIPLIALMGKQPEFRDYNQNQVLAQQIQGLKNQNALAPGQQQEQQQRLAMNQRAIEDQKYQFEQRKAINEAYKNALQPDEKGVPHFNTDSLTQALSLSGHGSAVPGILEGINKFQESRNKLMESSQKLQEGQADMLGYAGQAIQMSKYDPAVAHRILDSLGDNPQIQQMKSIIDANPQQFKQMVDSAVSSSPAQQKMKNTLDVANIRAQGKPPEGEMPLGDKVPQYNAALQNRWQVLNPGQPLPDTYKLGPNATQKDYDRLNQSLAGTEAATAAKASRDAAAAARAAADEERRANRADKQDKDNLQPVVGKDASGNDVLVSAGDAKKMNLSGTMKADADLLNKATAARDWLKLAGNKVAANGNPSDMGIMQLIDRLDKEGKLGTVASRWNDFMAGKVGSADPDVAALRNKMGLSTTKLMQAHVGSRGGAFMLEHFEDLANSGKMTASTLRSSMQSELNYMKDVAKLPGGSNGNSGGGKQLPSFNEWKASQ